MTSRDPRFDLRSKPKKFLHHYLSWAIQRYASFWARTNGGWDSRGGKIYPPSPGRVRLNTSPGRGLRIEAFSLAENAAFENVLKNRSILARKERSQKSQTFSRIVAFSLAKNAPFENVLKNCSILALINFMKFIQGAIITFSTSVRFKKLGLS